MDVNKIEKLIANIAKNGDKKTLELVSELLIEVSKYEGKTSTPKKETPIQESAKPKTTLDKAGSILDSLGSYDKPKPTTTYSNKPAAHYFSEHRTPRAPVVQEDYTGAFSSMFASVQPAPVAPVMSAPIDIPVEAEIPYTPGPPVQGFDSAITNYAALL